MNLNLSGPKNKDSRPPTLIVILLGFVFAFATIGLINDVSTWKGIRPFGALSDVFAQVGGFALNTKKISKQLDGGGNLLESNDRCQVIDPNKAEIKTASQLSRLALPSLEGNMGGANTSIVLDYGYDEELNTKILNYASDLNMSYNLGLVTVNNPASVLATAKFIKESNAAGMMPIIRLCVAGVCSFKDQNQIIEFYNSVHGITSSDEYFIGVVGPNEPGSGEPEIEMKGFVDGLDYGALIDETNQVAKALQSLRPSGVNAGHMLIAPAIFNLTNSVNNDVKEYLYSGRLDPDLYDYFLGNTYELSKGVSAYDFYSLGAETNGENSLKAYADGKDIPVIVSEFGAFFESYPGRRSVALEEQKQSFAKFCQDGNVEGVLFFRSFLNENGSVALNDELVWKDRHGMTPSEHAEIIGDCPVQKKAGFKDFSWANCNFDSCLYPKEYSTNSTATACGTETENRTFNLENGAALKVVQDGDMYITKKIGTVEVSMPIKQFGSNSSAGTSSLPYTPICAEVAAYYANSEVDALNQFAGVLKNADGSTTYAMPWLGSAINCSAELILASNEFARLSDKANLNPGSSSLETFKELNSSQNPFGTKYWEEYFGMHGGKSLYNTPWIPQGNEIQDEKALCIDSLGYCLDKGVSSDTINGLRDYLPQNTPSRYKKTSCSSEAIYLENQSNYIIGPEVVVEPASEVWRGTGSEVCRKYANRKNTDKDVLAGVDYPSQLGGVLSEQYQAAALDCQIKNETKVINGSSFYCPNMAGLKSFNFCSKDKIQKGECSIPAEYADCLTYNREDGDEIYIKTDKWPDAPNYSIPGVYDSLYRMYQRLQTQMSERGLKMVFRENLGWKVEVTSKVRDAGRPLAESNDRGLPDVIPYRYSQDLDSCEVPTNIFDNGTLLAKTNPTKTEYQYYDWLGYLDILQELSSAYTKDSTFSAEKLIDNPNYGKNNAANNTRRKVLETGLASITTSFPVLTCDQVEQWKFDENPVQSSSTTDSSNQPSTQYYCPVEAGLCGKGPYFESHEEGNLNAVDLFNTNYKGGDQNVIAPFDGKITKATAAFDYCINNTKSGGVIHYEGLIDGKKVKLMFLHVLVDDNVKVGNEYKAGQRITRVSKLSDPDVTDPNQGGCIGTQGPHLHMEMLEGSYKSNLNGFAQALGCSMHGAEGVGYDDYNKAGGAESCNVSNNLTLGAQGQITASVSSTLATNPDAQIKPDDKLTCITDTSDKRFDDELGEFLCSKGYKIEGLCDESAICKKPEDTQSYTCPVSGGYCLQGPYDAKISHGVLNAVDIYGTKVIAPMDGTIVDATEYHPYCNNKTRAGGAIWFQGKVNGEIITLFMYHVEGSKSLIGKSFSKGELITNTTKPCFVTINEDGSYDKAKADRCEPETGISPSYVYANSKNPSVAAQATFKSLVASCIGGIQHVHMEVRANEKPYARDKDYDINALAMGKFGCAITENSRPSCEYNALPQSADTGGEYCGEICEVLPETKVIETSGLGGLKYAMIDKRSNFYATAPDSVFQPLDTFVSQNDLDFAINSSLYSTSLLGLNGGNGKLAYLKDAQRYFRVAFVEYKGELKESSNVKIKYKNDKFAFIDITDWFDKPDSEIQSIIKEELSNVEWAVTGSGIYGTDDGYKETDEYQGISDVKNNRTLIGVKVNGDVVLATMASADLADIINAFKQMNVTYGTILDGGGSTTMYSATGFEDAKGSTYFNDGKVYIPRGEVRNVAGYIGVRTNGVRVCTAIASGGKTAEVSNESIQNLCSPNTITYDAFGDPKNITSADVERVYAAMIKVAPGGANNPRLKERIKQVLEYAAKPNVNINPAFLFALMITEGSVLGDNVAGDYPPGSPLYPVGYDFGCGLSGCGIVDRLVNPPPQSLTDERFTMSMQCAGGTGCTLACRYENLLTKNQQELEQMKADLQKKGIGMSIRYGPGLGGFLQCYGPYDSGNPNFARVYTEFYDTLFDPNDPNEKARRIDNGQCIMKLVNPQ